MRELTTLGTKLFCTEMLLVMERLSMTKLSIFGDSSPPARMDLGRNLELVDH